jgi:aspartate racemase
MKTLGLLGGMSWESTEAYYRLLNLAVKRDKGGLHSAKLLIHSFDFAEIERLQMQQKWPDLAYMLVDAACGLQNAGADLMMIGTNTMHKVADSIQQAIDIPLLHIGDATAQAIMAAGYNKVGLLGTRFTMEEDFYRRRIEEQYAIETMIPGSAERMEVNRIIYQELCKGNISTDSRDIMINAIQQLVSRGAQGIILGCTEIGLLVKPQDVDVTLFDTTALHAEFAVKAAIN